VSLRKSQSRERKDLTRQRLVIMVLWLRCLLLNCVKDSSWTRWNLI